MKKEAHVTRTITDIEVEVGPKTTIGDREGGLSVVGMNSLIPEGVRIHPGVAVYPNLGADHFTQKEYRTGEIVK